MNLELSCQDGVTVARVLDAALDAVGADDFKKRIGARVEQGERLLADRSGDRRVGELSGPRGDVPGVHHVARAHGGLPGHRRSGRA